MFKQGLIVDLHKLSIDNYWVASLNQFVYYFGSLWPPPWQKDELLKSSRIGLPTQMVLVIVTFPHFAKLSPIVKESVTAPDTSGNAVNVTWSTVSC